MRSSDIDSVTESLSIQVGTKLSKGMAVNIEEILNQVPKEQHAAFFERLNSIAAGFANPGSLSEFDANVDARDTLAATAEQSFIDSHSMSQCDATRTFEIELNPRQLILGDYYLEGELGRGGMGVVYKARHRERGDIVALKILPQVDGESLHRFKREFRSLADISHPNLVGLRSFESIGDQWFFTMDLIENARSFLRYVRPNNELDVERLHDAIMQLCGGIQKLHRLNILHRDLKPSNVVVDSNGRVVVLDFGLVSELKRNDLTLTQHSVSGTPAYMSPEAAGAEHETFTSDWYSLGVMLYQAIKGRLPFEGEPYQIMSDKRSQAAPEIGPCNSISDDILQLCMRLLDRQKENRPGYEQIVQVFGDVSKMVRVSRISDQEILLGREWHLATLNSAYRKVEENFKPVVSFVHGMSGKGKTCLVGRFLTDLKEREDVLILSGRCYDRESVPFKALDCLIDSLASYLRSLDVSESAALLPDDTGFLASLFPVLTRVKVIADRPKPKIADLDQQQVRKRAFSAMRILLRRLCERVQVVLFIDDLQWGDSDSAEAIVDVLTGEEPPPLLFLGSFRSDERNSSPFFVTWDRLLNTHQDSTRANATLQSQSLCSIDIEVGSLTLTHCEQLVANRLGEDSSETRILAQQLLNETGGVAYFVAELLECVDLQERRMHKVPMVELIANKLSQLPEIASDLLKALSAAGHATLSSELTAATGCQTEAASAISKMRTLKLIRTVGVSGHDELLDTYHDKIRETVYAGLGSDGRKHQHLKLLEAIESQPNSIELRVFDLSNHAESCGDSAKAKRYALLAAEQAMLQLSPRIAVEQYGIAYRNSPSGVTTAGSFSFAEGYAHALMLTADYERAEAITKEATASCESAIQQARLYELRAAAERRRGEAFLSADSSIAGLRALSIKVPKSLLGTAISIGHLFIRRLVLESLPFKKKPQTPESALSIRLCSELAWASSFSIGPMMVWSTLKALSIQARQEETAQFGKVHTFYGTILAVLGSYRRSSHHIQRGLKIRQKHNDRLGVGESTCWLGITHWAAGEYQKAVETITEGILILSEVGDEWTINLAMFHRAMAYYNLGRLEDAIVESNYVIQRCLSSNDSRIGCASYGILRASGGLADLEELRSRRRDYAHDFLAVCNINKGEAISYAQAGMFDLAIKSATLACNLPIKQRLPNYHTFAAAPIALHVLRRHLSSLSRSSTEFRKQLRKAKKLVWVAASLSRVLPSEASFTWREIGEIARLCDRPKKALRHYEKSIKIAERQNARYELAQSLLFRARILAQESPTRFSDELESCERIIEGFNEQIKKGLERIGNKLPESRTQRP